MTEATANAGLAAVRPARTAAGAARRITAAWPLLAICLGAVAIRALTCALIPNIVWPDETFQATEQALRLVSGHGLTPWEFQVGARSWILPGLAAPLVALGRALSPDPRAALGLIAALMIAVAAAGVWAAYALGARFGRLQGLFAAGLAAGWCELVYYSPHLLPDTLGGTLLLGALALGARAERRGRLFWTGLLLGAAWVVRIQLSPAIGLAGVLTCRTSVRSRWLPLAAGFALPAAALGALDWLTWGAPFHSVIVYVRTNLGGVASQFGALPPFTYLAWELRFWGAAAPLILLTAGLGARRAPGLAAVAATTALTFAAVGHKEPRFLYPALLLLIVLCGIGAGEVAEDAGRRLRTPLARRAVPLTLALLWAAASLGVGFDAAMRPLWLRETPIQRALGRVNSRPDSCGLGLRGSDWDVTGLSRLRRGVALYDAATTPADAYDYLLRLPGPDRPLAGYLAQGFALERCYGPGVCLYRRPGPCAAGRPTLQASTAPRLREALRRLGYQVY